MKKNFKEADVEIINLRMTDVIATSSKCEGIDQECTSFGTSGDDCKAYAD